MVWSRHDLVCLTAVAPGVGTAVTRHGPSRKSRIGVGATCGLRQRQYHDGISGNRTKYIPVAAAAAVTCFACGKIAGGCAMQLHGGICIGQVRWYCSIILILMNCCEKQQQLLCTTMYYCCCNCCCCCVCVYCCCASSSTTTAYCCNCGCCCVGTYNVVVVK